MNVDFRNRHILISDVFFRLRLRFFLVGLSDMNLGDSEIFAFYFFFLPKNINPPSNVRIRTFFFYYIKLIKTVIARLLMKSAKRLPTSGTRR